MQIRQKTMLGLDDLLLRDQYKSKQARRNKARRRSLLILYAYTMVRVASFTLLYPYIKWE